MRRKEQEPAVTGKAIITKRYWLILIGICLFCGWSMPSSGQCTAKNEAFLPGEKVEYDLFFNWKFIWYKAGLARLTTSSVQYQSKQAYRLDLLAVGSKRADFFFKMRDTISSIITEQLEPRYYRKAAEEGKRYTVDEAFFTTRNGFSNVKQKRTNYRDGDVTETEFNESHCIHDMLSILAHARSFDPDNFTVGQRLKFSMATGRRVEDQTLIYRGRKTFKAENKRRYNCLVFSLVEMDKGKEKEVITFYVTDDKNHLPVRLDLFLNFGSAKAFLRDVTGNRHPFTSIVD